MSPRRKRRRKETAAEYAERYFAQLSFPMFTGVKPFRELFKAGRILPLYTPIRVSPSGIYHTLYYATEDGKLVEWEHLDVTLEPEDVIGDRWTLEAIVPEEFAEKRE